MRECLSKYCKFVAFNKGIILFISLPKIYLTMREIIFSVLLLIFGLSIQAQPAEFFTVGGNVDQNDTINVDVKAYNLTDLFGLEYFHKYDTAKLEWVGMSDLNPDLASLSLFHPTDKSHLVVSWNSASSKGANFQDTTLLYRLQFRAKGPKGSKDTIKYTTGQNGFVVLNSNGDDIPRVFHNGIVTINGVPVSQPIKLSFTNAAGNKNDEVCIDLNVENFKRITDFGFAITWDNAVATYSKVTNLNPNVPGLNAGVFNLLNGNLRAVWVNPQDDTVTLSGKSRLVSICFNLTGSKGASTFVRIDSVDNPRPLHVEFNTPDGPADYELFAGKLLIYKGGGGGGTDNFTFVVGNSSVKMGENGCVPITVKNYTKIFGFEFPILYDNNLLTNPEIKNLNLGLDTTDGFFSSLLNPGEFFISHVDIFARTLSNDTKLFDICFDAVGPCDSKPSIVIKAKSRSVEVYDENTDLVEPVDVVDGSINITCGGGGGVDSLIVIAGTKKVNKGEEVCVPFTVRKFNKISGLQFVMHWDSTVLRLKNTNYVRAFNLPRLNAGNFSLQTGTESYLAFAAWNSDNPVTVADNTKIFEVCYDAVGDCDAMSAITIVDRGRVTIEALDENSDLVPVSVRKGKVSIECPQNNDITVTLDEVTLPTCHGKCDGKITVKVDPVDTYAYQWYKNGQPISGSAGRGSQLRDVCAGEYFVSIKKNSTGATDSSQTIVINDPPAIKLNKTVTPDMGNCEGKVEVNPTGGYGRFELTWSRVGVSGPVIDNLCKDSVVILILKDSVPMLRWNGNAFDTVSSLNPRFCVLTDTTKVPMKMSDLDCTGTVQNTSCAESCDGSITLNTTGGTGTISYKWTGNGITDPSQKDQTGLCAGDYTVEVTDETGTTVTKKFTVNAPTPIVATSIQIDSATGNKSNGKIIVNVSGGTPPYTYRWMDSNGNTISTSKNLSGVPKGKYTLIVTDDNACTGMAMFVVPMKNDDRSDITVTTSKYNGGYNTPCNGDREAWIKVSGAPANSDFTWSHDATLKDTIAKNLSAGTYSVTVKDAQGNTLLDTTIILTEPTALKGQVNALQCASSEGATDAQYAVIPMGGTAPYTYQWCDNSTDSITNNLPGGVNCNLIISDANDCEYIVTFKVCVTTDTTGAAECYQGRKVITPNNDNFNDFLLITCDNKYDNKLTVYDRWGRLVYEKVNYQSSAGDGWRGVDLNGNELNEGGYMWILRVDLPNGDQRYYKGTVIIAK